MNILKSLIIWLCFIPVAILNGGLREYALVKAISEKWALLISGITLSVCIFLITWLLLPRIDNESRYHPRLLADRNMLERFNHSF